MRISNVSEPTISVYMPTKAKSNGTAVIVCPGGGYNILAYQHEGIEVCNWLNDLGVTGILLKYRVPRRKDRLPHEAPLQDLQRAYGIVRQNARNWKIHPERIGVLGFSAGGNLAIMGLTSFHERSYKQLDEADKFSCRPDFGILIYPAYLVDREKRTTLFSEIKITSETPPCFFVHTGDDRVPAEGSVLAYLALEKAGVNGNELHVYPFGGHGYGMRKTDKPVSNCLLGYRNLDASNGLDEGQMNKVNRAVRYLNHGSPSDVLRMENLTLGKLRSREVRIEVQAATIHPSDIGLIQEVMGI